MTDPVGAVIDIIFGRWRSQVLYAGVKLGVFDAIGDAPKPAADIASELGLDPALGYRLLRGLSAVGLLNEDGGRAFSLTETGRVLASDHPQSQRGTALLEEGPEHYALWKHLPDMVRDGEQNAFVREFGRSAFEHAVADPGYAEVFDAAMTSYSGAQSAMVLGALGGYDFSGLKTVCDIAGGRGHLLCSLLSAQPHMTGAVLKRSEVIADAGNLWAEPMGVADRAQFVAGDMFEAAPEADAYFMKMILHDWNDDECVAILKTCAAAATPDARLFIVEHIVTPPETPHFAKLFDIHMMCWGTGRERTEAEYQDLMRRAGWTPVAAHYPDPPMMGVVEGRLNPWNPL